MSPPETHAVQARYARRDNGADAQRYSLYANAASLQAQQERLRAMACLWRLHGWASLADRPLLEVGCGSGGNLLDLLRLGATPAQLTGIELLRKVRGSEEFADMPFLMVTAEAQQENIIEAVQAKVSNYIVKPFTAEVMKQKIDKIFP